MKDLFNSKRLRFRPLRQDDLNDLSALNQDPHVMRYYPALKSQQESYQFIVNQARFQERFGFSFYGLDHLSTGAFFGFLGFSQPNFDLGFGPFIEIGWCFHRDFWNLGLGSEGARACLHYGFETLRIEDVYAFTSSINIASERVMQKIGMRQVSTFKHPRLEAGHKLSTHYLYHISRVEG